MTSCHAQQKYTIWRQGTTRPCLLSYNWGENWHLVLYNHNGDKCFRSEAIASYLTQSYWLRSIHPSTAEVSSQCWIAVEQYGNCSAAGMQKKVSNFVAAVLKPLTLRSLQSLPPHTHADRTCCTWEHLNGVKRASEVVWSVNSLQTWYQKRCQGECKLRSLLAQSLKSKSPAVKLNCIFESLSHKMERLMGTWKGGAQDYNVGLCHLNTFRSRKAYVNGHTIRYRRKSVSCKMWTSAENVKGGLPEWCLSGFSAWVMGWVNKKMKRRGVTKRQTLMRDWMQSESSWLPPFSAIKMQMWSYRAAVNSLYIRMHWVWNSGAFFYFLDNQGNQMI